MGMIRSMGKLREFYRREKMLFIKASKFEKVLLLIGLPALGFVILLPLVFVGSFVLGGMLGLYWVFSRGQTGCIRLLIQTQV